MDTPTCNWHNTPKNTYNLYISSKHSGLTKYATEYGCTMDEALKKLCNDQRQIGEIYTIIGPDGTIRNIIFEEPPPTKITWRKV